MDGRRNFPEPDADSRWYPDDRGYDDRGYDDRRDDRMRDDRGRDDRGRDDRDWDDRPRDPRGREDADRGYGDEREGRGYTPTRYAEEREYDDGYRVPDPRGGGRGYGADPLSYGDSPSGQFSAPAPAGRSVDTGDLSGEFGGRSRRSEAIDRSALQRPVSGGGPSGAGSPALGSPALGSPALGSPGLGSSGLGPSDAGSSGAGLSGLSSSGAPIPGLPSQGIPGGIAGQGIPGQGMTSQQAGGPGALGPGATGPVSGGPVSGAPVSSGPTGAPPSAFVAPTTLTAAIPAPQQYGQGAEPAGAVYRSKRPGLAVVLVVLTILFEVPILRLFISAMTAKEILAGATLSGIFMIPALPMFALGLYGLIGGAAAAAPGARAWLRTPLVYLPVALLLFVAAGLAAS
ncbi:hypothetical protein ABT297_25255 [Dactylosporangium sp. NPDC000555]|uniref:hypothetical protein n=1 Tax=Dactylosporangium sp. NPDC000555 TaxID=3154260 RepID=UPI003319907A